mmetsp:Transcript_17749/g.25052  ORF Transcript_17749/g.25052 Transcript_17749/m.25052 type:complete len:107 (-) Transcript_17749:127-447(-)
MSVSRSINLRNRTVPAPITTKQTMQSPHQDNVDENNHPPSVIDVQNQPSDSTVDAADMNTTNFQTTELNNHTLDTRLAMLTDCLNDIDHYCFYFLNSVVICWEYTI